MLPKCGILSPRLARLRSKVRGGCHFAHTNSNKEFTVVVWHLNADFTSVHYTSAKNALVTKNYTAIT